MKRRAATRYDVLRAIEESRLRVRDGSVETKRAELKAKWREPKLEEVAGPHQSKPYHRVQFSTSEGHFRCLVHRLVWWAAGRGIRPGLEIDHVNGDKLDNRLENLHVVTSSTNAALAYEQGLQPRVRAPRSNNRFTADQVRDVRRRGIDPEVSLHDLAKEFGVTRWMIAAIVDGRRYGHVA